MTRLTAGKCLFGMSCDDDPVRLSEFGYPTNPVKGIRDFGNDAQMDMAVAGLNRKQVAWVSFKPGDWGNAANGSFDTALIPKLRILARAAKANDTDVLISYHHEFITKSSLPLGEGGTSAEFWAMQTRLTNLAYQIFTEEGARQYCKPLLCSNGWTARPQNIGGTKGLTTAEKATWFLGPNNIGPTLFEGRFGGDYYRKPGENNMPSTDQFPHVESWGQSVGYTSFFVGEYAAPDDAAGLTELDRQAAIFWRTGTPWAAVYYWNSDGTEAQFGLDVGSTRMTKIRQHANIAEAFNSEVEEPEEPPVPVPVPTNLRATVFDSNMILLEWDNDPTVVPEIWAYQRLIVLPAGTEETVRGPVAPSSYAYRIRNVRGTEVSEFVTFPTVTVEEPPVDWEARFTAEETAHTATKAELASVRGIKEQYRAVLQNHFNEAGQVLQLESE